MLLQFVVLFAGSIEIFGAMFHQPPHNAKLIQFYCTRLPVTDAVIGSLFIV